MIDSEKNEFAAMFKASMSIYQQEAGTEVLRLWWAALSRFDISQVREAFSRHIQDAKAGKFAPRPADIIGVIEAMNPDGRIGAEEAWAMYPHDEASSAVITNEMAEAMQAARTLLNEGDKVGARMAFKEAYVRITTQNKFNGIAPRWFPSLGHDAQGREEALKLAVQKGRLTQDHATALLPAPVHSNVTRAIGELKLIAADEAKSELTPEQLAINRKRIAELKEMLVR
jgi:hypothetical protein